MKLTPDCRALWSSSSNPPRTSCSGRGTGARNLGLRTILEVPALGSLEACITISCAQHRRPRLRPPYGRWYTIAVPVRRRGKDLQVLDPQALAGFDLARRSSLDFSRSQPKPNGFRQLLTITRLAADSCILRHKVSERTNPGLHVGCTWGGDPVARFARSPRTFPLGETCHWGMKAFLQRDKIGAHDKQAVHERRIAGIT